MIVAIDPGQRGAIVSWDEGKIEFWDDARLQVELEKSRRDIRIYLEDVGMHIRGDSASRSVLFARMIGRLEGMITTLGYEIKYVRPQVWLQVVAPDRPKSLTKKEREAWIATLGKRAVLEGIKRANAARKRARKRYIKELMQARFPNLRVTLDNADALGILSYALTKEA